MVSRSLIYTYQCSTPAEKAAGVNWYKNARALCHDMARTYGVTFDTVCGVVAALSPRKSWKANITETRKALTGNKIGHFKPCVDKANAIIRGYSPLDVLRGPKTRAFYCGIRGYSSEVTIDVWIMRALGLSKNTLTPRDYNVYANAIRCDAKHLGVQPYILQAVTWVQTRGKAD